MKKRTISAIILMALIIATFSIFAMPASANSNAHTPLEEATIVEPGDPIIVSEKYSEFQLDLPRGGTYNFPLYIDSGYHIIQTFGCTTTTFFQLMDEDGSILVSSNATNTKGYGNNAFMHYDFSSGIYTLRVRVGETSPIRLSVTKARDFATEYGTLPMTQFEDIAAGTEATVDFYLTTPAIVFRYIPTSAQDCDCVIETIGTGSMKVHFMDPSSKTAFDLVTIVGEGETPTPTLTIGKEYYVVMYQPIVPGGDLPSIDYEYFTLTVRIG